MWKTWRAVPTNDSTWLITQAAFYFNHINEAFNLTARFTSRRCVAPLGSILDENSFSFPPHRCLSRLFLSNSTSSALSHTPPPSTARSFLRVGKSSATYYILLRFHGEPSRSAYANNCASFRAVYTCRIVPMCFTGLRRAPLP